MPPRCTDPLQSPTRRVLPLLRSLSRLLGVAADDLDLIRRYVLTAVIIVQLEGDILDEECPHFVAESVRVETPLEQKLFSHGSSNSSRGGG